MTCIMQCQENYSSTQLFFVVNKETLLMESDTTFSTTEECVLLADLTPSFFLSFVSYVVEAIEPHIHHRLSWKKCYRRSLLLQKGSHNVPQE